MTTIYLVRHSKPIREEFGLKDIKDDVFLSNVKTPLSVEGEKLAEKISSDEEFSNIDVIWSSNYVRTISTAKYFAHKNNLKINISDKLGERIHGIKTWDELPSDFETHQFDDENYKIGNGESRKEVTKRLLGAINYLISKYKNKRILVVGHSTAFAFLLSTWCNISYTSPYTYNGKVILEEKWNYCETFKLTFDDQDNLIDIENIKLER